MPGTPPSVDTELDALVVYLRQQRDGLKNAAFGLTDEQLRATPTRSALSVGGLLKHATTIERSWTRTIEGRAAEQDQDAYRDTFALVEGDTAELLSTELDRAAAETEAALAAADLGSKVQLPDAPWLPRDPDGFSVRWIALHIIEELARHAGHADIIREHVDGATMYALMAGVEGWPETEWVKPWRPPAAS